MPLCPCSGTYFQCLVTFTKWTIESLLQNAAAWMQRLVKAKNSRKHLHFVTKASFLKQGALPNVLHREHSSTGGLWGPLSCLAQGSIALCAAGLLPSALGPSGVWIRSAQAGPSSHSPNTRPLCRARRTAEGNTYSNTKKLQNNYTALQQWSTCCYLSRCQSSDWLRERNPHRTVHVQSNRAGNWKARRTV